MKKILEFFNNYYFRIIKILAFTAGGVGLLLSGPVIKDFANIKSETYGFYYFIFILFGLVIIFFSLTLEKKLITKFFALGALAITLVAGFIFLNQMVSTAIDGISGIIIAFLVTVAAIAIYILITIMIIITIIKSLIRKKA